MAEAGPIVVKVSFDFRPLLAALKLMSDIVDEMILAEHGYR